MIESVALWKLPRQIDTQIDRQLDQQRSIPETMLGEQG